MRDLRILLVDDHADFVEAAAKLLALKPGLTIVGTTNGGREAVQQARNLEPDLVMIDLMMPDVNGLLTTRLLKQLPAPPWVIIMSLHDETAFRTAAQEAGAEGYVAKGEFWKQLLPLLDQLRAQTRDGAPRPLPQPA